MRRTGAALLLTASVLLGMTPDERTLARHGLEPNRESLGRYLRLIHPDDALRERVDDLIRGLGDARATTREFAMRELMRLDSAPVAALERAAKNDDPEVRRRARYLLETARSRLKAEVLYSVFRVIAARKIAGLAPEVLRAIPLAQDSYVRRAAQEALLATVRQADLPMLLKSATGGDPETRMASLAAMRKVRGKAAAPVLRAALRAPSGRVRLTAAAELANLGDRAALPVLVALLESHDAWVRFRTVATLRAICGHAFGYSAGSEPNRRAAATRKWRDWLERNGATIEWKTPLKTRDVGLGRTLVAVYSDAKVIEFDDNGKIVWTVAGIRNPWAVRGLPTGHRLITHYSENRVAEYDTFGKQVWISDKLPGTVSSVDQARNGNVLVAIGYTRNEILEIGRDKSIVRRITLAGKPVCARALPDGHLLVTLNEAGSVVEIDDTGRILWEVKGLNQPYSAERLPNGNVLVACFGSGRIAEFDRDGVLVWEKRNIRNVYTAERFADGSNLYGDAKGVHHYSADGTLRWQKVLTGDYIYIDRY
ncbi:MAG: HEAT repeat domain-containing protein [Planctomycetota bacterium]|jgi:hypothetical protein